MNVVGLSSDAARVRRQRRDHLLQSTWNVPAALQLRSPIRRRCDQNATRIRKLLKDCYSSGDCP